MTQIAIGRPHPRIHRAPGHDRPRTKVLVGNLPHAEGCGFHTISGIEPRTDPAPTPGVLNNSAATTSLRWTNTFAPECDSRAGWPRRRRATARDAKAARLRRRPTKTGQLDGLGVFPGLGDPCGRGLPPGPAGATSALESRLSPALKAFRAHPLPRTDERSCHGGKTSSQRNARRVSPPRTTRANGLAGAIAGEGPRQGRSNLGDRILPRSRRFRSRHNVEKSSALTKAARPRCSLQGQHQTIKPPT